MNKLYIAKKVLSGMTCSALALGIVTAYVSAPTGSQDVSAKTIAEIQEQRKQNSEKIAALETEISGLEGDKANEKAYQDTLTEQIGLIQENINLLNAELEGINEDITSTEANIKQLDQDIDNQQVEIDENIELFKKRLCAMYISSSENPASVILGSDSFYDIMSRVQVINKVAEYDEELITSILDEIDNLEASKKDLESERLSLQMKLEDQEKRKEEKTAEVETLNGKIALTQAEIDRISKAQEDLERDKADIEADQAALDAEEQAIQAEITRKAAEAQRLYEEQQRRLAEERAAQAAAAAAAQAAAAQQQESSGDSSGSTETYVAPAPAEPITYDATPSASGFSWPVPGHSGITSYFGARWGTYHRGIDISDGGIMGAAVCAAKAGTVVTVSNSCTHNYAKSSSCGCGGGYGNYVVISHDGTYSTLYGHLSSAAVSVGDYVSQGQVIGYAGTTGWSTGAHLHFEVRAGGSQVDPMGYVSP